MAIPPNQQNNSQNNVHTTDQPIKDNDYGLFSAAQNGAEEDVVHFLQRGASVNSIFCEGNSPLLAAASGGHIKVVQALLSSGANVNHTDAKGLTALHLALTYSHLDVAFLLLQNGGSLHPHNSSEGPQPVQTTLSTNSPSQPSGRKGYIVEEYDEELEEAVPYEQMEFEAGISFDSLALEQLRPWLTFLNQKGAETMTLAKDIITGALLRKQTKSDEPQTQTQNLTPETPVAQNALRSNYNRLIASASASKIQTGSGPWAGGQRDDEEEDEKDSEELSLSAKALLREEVILVHSLNVLRIHGIDQVPVYGELFLTNFRLIHASSSTDHYPTSIALPLTMIESVEWLGETMVEDGQTVHNTQQGHSHSHSHSHSYSQTHSHEKKCVYACKLQRKDFSIDLVLATISANELNSLMKKIRSSINPHLRSLFAFSYRVPKPTTPSTHAQSPPKPVTVSENNSETDEIFSLSPDKKEISYHLHKAMQTSPWLPLSSSPGGSPSVTISPRSASSTPATASLTGSPVMERMPHHPLHNVPVVEDSDEMAGRGWESIDLAHEYRRVELVSNEPDSKSFWRITEANKEFGLSESYPRVLCVPSSISDEDLPLIADTRTKRRFPVAVWRSPRTSSVLLRCSQPRSSTLVGSRSFELDDKYISAIWEASGKGRVAIMDARPRLNAMVNVFRGGGVESPSNYSVPVSLSFLDIQNIHVMRKALENLRTQCLSYVRERIKEVDKSLEWRGHLSLIIRGAVSVASLLDPSYGTATKKGPSGSQSGSFHTIESLDSGPSSDGLQAGILFGTPANYVSKSAPFRNIGYLGKSSSDGDAGRIGRASPKIMISASSLPPAPTAVIVHCSDGWDRTAQIVSLAEILLDPHYRTMHGFQELIDKEWLSFGHKFSHRVGPSKHDKERSPVFLQFVDSVWQLWVQFPSAFEFNERFLLSIVHHLYSCQFGTFLCNSEKERVEHHVSLRTCSLWDHLNSIESRSPGTYRNLENDISDSPDFISPVTEASSLSVWTAYYKKNFLIIKNER